MRLNQKVNPLRSCFRKKINPIIFKEYCKFFNIPDQDKGKTIQDLRHRGYNINISIPKEIKLNPRKEFLIALGVKRF